ncbi:sulfotransferase 1C1-like [Sebastes fasciatus]|uniref:sulfotransferase 1C1-like n=1 Tax=Sebastes fasciatus TaxID=394691 RepID=UPI003D9FAF2F
MSEEEQLSFTEAILKASPSLTRFPLISIKGVPLKSYIADNWDDIWAFSPDPSDVLIATYPKAGTTWTQEIVDLLLHNGDAEACRRAPMPIRFPFLENFYPPPIPSGLDLLKTMDPPRIIKTHLAFHLVPPAFWENKCKTIYVARNAKDNLSQDPGRATCPSSCGESVSGLNHIPECHLTFIQTGYFCLHKASNRTELPPHWYIHPLHQPEALMYFNKFKHVKEVDDKP